MGKSQFKMDNERGYPYDSGHLHMFLHPNTEPTHRRSSQVEEPSIGRDQNDPVRQAQAPTTQHPKPLLSWTIWLVLFFLLVLSREWMGMGWEWGNGIIIIIIDSYIPHSLLSTSKFSHLGPQKSMFSLDYHYK